MLHGHEQSVEYNADGDGQVDKRVHYHKMHPLFEEHPLLATVPLEKLVGKLVPGRRTRPLGLLQL